jgi:hypothetical protein
MVDLADLFVFRVPEETNSQSSKHINSTIRHELLEQQYQDLRKLMVERNEQSKPGKGTSRQRQSDQVSDDVDIVLLTFSHMINV